MEKCEYVINVRNLDKETRLIECSPFYKNESIKKQTEEIFRKAFNAERAGTQLGL